MTGQAAAYIRRSSASAESPGDASRDAQLAAVRGLCGEEVQVFTDWGMSGANAERPDYMRLKAAIAAGEVSSVCAYSLSRLGRSVRELLTFVDLCRDRGVTIRTKVENIDTATAMGTFTFTLFAAIAQLESELAKERSAAARATKRERGDRFGLPPYGYTHVRDENRRIILAPDPDEPLQPILDAYRDAGTVLGAARLLEARGIPAPKGGKRWATSALTRIIEREAPELLPQRTATGRRSPSSAMFASLLRCPFCGRMLTPNVTRGQYYCPNGPRDRDAHPRYAVREVDVLPFLQAEADRLEIPAEAVAVEGIESRQETINVRLERAHELYMAGDIDRAKYDAEKARHRRETDDLQGRASVAAIAPVVDWTARPEVINTALRSIWREVRLDERLRPIEVDWVAPEWRA